MSYKIQLGFVMELLKNMCISSCVIYNYQETIPTTIDLELRKTLFGIDDYAGFFENSMSQAKPNTVYRFYDEYFCNYIFMRLPDIEKEKFFFIGPYIPAKVDETRIREKYNNETTIAALIKYYNRLPIIEDDSILVSITNSLGNIIWGSPQNYSTEYVEYMIHDREKSPEPPPPHDEHRNSPFSIDVLESNNNKENALMEAVSSGKLHIINSIISFDYNSDTEQKLSDSLRNQKNHLISLNTLLRKAAEYGDVHPLHINKMSSSFVRQIENIRTVEQIFRLQTEMIRSYCLLVKRHSLKGYSYLIGKTITLITYDLSADLTLSALAKQLNVNPSYLSALFKKECGCTLTEYVNNKRIEYSLTLLRKTDKLVYQIAYDCGFQDTNYFIKLFKKITGQTPSQYRKQTGHK